MRYSATINHESHLPSELEEEREEGWHLEWNTGFAMTPYRGLSFFSSLTSWPDGCDCLDQFLIVAAEAYFSVSSAGAVEAMRCIRKSFTKRIHVLVTSP